NRQGGGGRQEKDGWGSNSRPAIEQIVNARGAKNSHERKQVCRGEDSAFGFPGRPVLEEGGNRDNKETAEESQEREAGRKGCEGKAGSGKPGAEAGQTEGAERDQAIFEF